MIYGVTTPGVQAPPRITKGDNSKAGWGLGRKFGRLYAKK